MRARATFSPRFPVYLAALGVSLVLGFGYGYAPPSLAAVGEGCPNEVVRSESNLNPTTGRPYSQGLPECRAYEMVSPLDKQQHDAISFNDPPFISIAPAGNAIEWAGQGDYAGAENYLVQGSSPANPYVAQRAAAGWVTRSAYPPPTLIEGPAQAFGSAGVYSPDLAHEAVCGTSTSTGEDKPGPAIRCALRDPDGLWTDAPEYSDLTGETFDGFITVGSSRDGEDYVFLGGKGAPFVSEDTSSGTENCSGAGHCGGIYEVTGIGTQSPELRLVNVDNSGSMIGPENVNDVGASLKEPYGGEYQAISDDGSKIFFTATPAGGVPTVYARVDGRETVAISSPSPSECTTCSATPQEALYQGASVDGSKVFFTTTQQLLNSDTDEETDLYEYDFHNPSGHQLIQISGGGLGDVTPGAGAKVQGVVSVSEDGSHVYFVAPGVLTTLPNGLGQIATSEADNLYAYDTDTNETKFVAPLMESDDSLWGFAQLFGAGAFDTRLAQATPDGRYLAFDTSAELITTGPEADTSGALQVYRYDFATGDILRVSLGHDGFADNGNVPGFDAIIGPAAGGNSAASPTVNDSNRTISESGESIAFVSAAQLQSTDVAGSANKSCNNGREDDDGAGCEVYAWHNGTVNMISDGRDPNGALYAGMSATGSDIFFQTRAPLVGQDTDGLGDIYDASIGGGFPAPADEPSCSGEACQGAPSPAPVWGGPGTASFTGGGDLTPGAVAFPAPKEAKPKPPTRAAKLADALKACTKDIGKQKRVTCERRARKRFGVVRRIKAEKK